MFIAIEYSALGVTDIRSYSTLEAAQAAELAANPDSEGRWKAGKLEDGSPTLKWDDVFSGGICICDLDPKKR